MFISSCPRITYFLPEQAFRRLPRAGASPCTPRANLFRLPNIYARAQPVGWATRCPPTIPPTFRLKPLQNLNGSLKSKMERRRLVAKWLIQHGLID
nr:hypothetical protein [uncultured Kingella sp.]